MSLLRQERLGLCILQVAEPDADDIANDFARPPVARALRQLLARGARDGREIDALLPPTTYPALVLAPELALGSPDWDDVDAAVRSSERPLVLIAGFGFTVGSRITDWGRTE